MDISEKDRKTSVMETACRAFLNMLEAQDCVTNPNLFEIMREQAHKKGFGLAALTKSQFEKNEFFGEPVLIRFTIGIDTE